MEEYAAKGKRKLDFFFFSLFCQSLVRGEQAVEWLTCLGTQML